MAFFLFLRTATVIHGATAVAAQPGVLPPLGSRSSVTSGSMIFRSAGNQLHRRLQLTGDLAAKGTRASRIIGNHG